MQKEEQVRPNCPKCGRKNVVFRKDGSLFCRVCGHDTSKDVKK